MFTQTAAEISATVDSILLTVDPIQGFRKFAEQYKKLSRVQGVDVYDYAMYVRYPDSIVHIWLLALPEPARDIAIQQNVYYFCPFFFIALLFIMYYIYLLQTIL